MNPDAPARSPEAAGSPGGWQNLAATNGAWHDGSHWQFSWDRWDKRTSIRGTEDRCHSGLCQRGGAQDEFLLNCRTNITILKSRQRPGSPGALQHQSAMHSRQHSGVVRWRRRTPRSSGGVTVEPPLVTSRTRRTLCWCAETSSPAARGSRCEGQNTWEKTVRVRINHLNFILQINKSRLEDPEGVRSTFKG